MDIESRRSLISIRVQMLCNLFGKRLTEEGADAVKRVFGDALENFSDRAISQGFAKAEQTLERFPTPRAMIELCAEKEIRSLEDEELGKYCKNCWPDGWWKRGRKDMPGCFFVVRCPCQKDRE